MNKIFNYSFIDLSSKSSIAFEYDGNVEEKLEVNIEDGVPVISGNKQTFLFLAKLFAKLSLSDYETGFHVHLTTDLDADKPEAVRIVLDNR